MLKFIVLFVLALEAQPQLQSGRPAGPPCRSYSFRSEVQQGEEFSRIFAETLVFRLVPIRNPEAMPGWNIEVNPVSDTTKDWSILATPPYHFDNDRYLDTSYGKTAAESVAKTPRLFGFAPNEEAEAQLERAYDRWRSGPSVPESDAGSRALTSIDKGTGELRILRARTRKPDNRFPYGVIESLQFEVRLCVPGVAAR